MAHVFEISSNAELHPNSAEVAHMKFMIKMECESLILSEADEFTPDAVILLQSYLRLQHG